MGFTDAEEVRGGAMRRPALHDPEGSANDCGRVRGLSAQQAELWITQRYRAFVLDGYPPDLSLMFAVHPEVMAPTQTSADRPLDTAA
jgi:hypothetical protein